MKEIIFSSLVAAALVFSGCGGSDSDNGGDSNDSSVNNGGDNGGDNNGSENIASLPDYITTVSVGGATWTVLYADKDDANESNGEVDGRISQNDARSKCQEWGMTLASKAQLDGNASELKVNATFRNDAPDDLVVWYGDVDLKGHYFNSSGDDVEDYTQDDYNDTTTNFFTCVKEANSAN
jgi:hypothetical protein